MNEIKESRTRLGLGRTDFALRVIGYTGTDRNNNTAHPQAGRGGRGAAIYRPAAVADRALGRRAWRATGLAGTLAA